MGFRGWCANPTNAMAAPDESSNYNHLMRERRAFEARCAPDKCPDESGNYNHLMRERRADLMIAESL